MSVKIIRKKRYETLKLNPDFSTLRRKVRRFYIFILAVFLHAGFVINNY